MAQWKNIWVKYLYGNRTRGKEYYNDGNLKFEGEFFLDMKYDGKEYDRNGNILFEIKNGSGFIKKYDGNGNLDFEGEYLNLKKMEK